MRPKKINTDCRDGGSGFADVERRTETGRGTAAGDVDAFNAETLSIVAARVAG